MTEDDENVLIELTETEEKVLDYIDTCITRDKLPPTRAEIARHMGFRSPNAAHEVVEKLAAKNRITIMRDIPRGIKLVDP